jgi:hypothetical protein
MTITVLGRLQPRDQFGSAVGLVIGRAGHWFVEQNDVRVGHQEHADF